jgi:SpoVK/Ycf46/Vps4 family AAA+-type ATPase
VSPDVELSHYYERAAQLILTGRYSYRVRRSDDTVLVQTVKQGSAKFSHILGDGQEHRRNVWVFEALEDVPPEFRSAADIFWVIEKPDLKICQTAIYMMCGIWASEEDSKLVLSQPWKRNAAMFRTGRSLQKTLQLLRQPLPPKDDRSKPLGTTDGCINNLKYLIGYGAAVDWGLQFAEDIAEYRAGRIGWDEVDSGILLSGPTGCGKTRFAEILARSTGTTLVCASSGLWQSAGHLGDYLREMRNTFDEARNKAPSILLIDEFDSFGNRTTADRENRDYQRQIVNAALECLDGTIRLEGVVVIGTTNYPEHIDPALLRAGRLGKHIEISLPDAKARIAILESYLGFGLSPAEVASVASSTEEWSGAQLEQLARDSRRQARREKRDPIGADVLALIPEALALPPENLRAAAIHECGHAIIALSVGRQVERIEIQDRFIPSAESQKVGSVHYRSQQFQRRNRNYYLDEILVSLGGVAAELEILGSFGDGAGGVYAADLTNATQLATLMEGVYGMGESLVSEVCETQDDITKLRLRNPLLMTRVDTVLAEQMLRASEVVRRNRDTIDILATEVAQKKTVTGKEINTFLVEKGHRIMGLHQPVVSGGHAAEP